MNYRHLMFLNVLEYWLQQGLAVENVSYFELFSERQFLFSCDHNNEVQDQTSLCPMFLRFRNDNRYDLYSFSYRNHFHHRNLWCLSPKFYRLRVRENKFHCNRKFPFFRIQLICHHSRSTLLQKKKKQFNERKFEWFQYPKVSSEMLAVYWYYPMRHW